MDKKTGQKYSTVKGVELHKKSPKDISFKQEGKKQSFDKKVVRPSPSTKSKSIQRRYVGRNKEKKAPPKTLEQKANTLNYSFTQKDISRNSKELLTEKSTRQMANKGDKVYFGGKQNSTLHTREKEYFNQPTKNTNSSSKATVSGSDKVYFNRNSPNAASSTATAKTAPSTRSNPYQNDYEFRRKPRQTKVYFDNKPTRHRGDPVRGYRVKGNRRLQTYTTRANYIRAAYQEPNAPFLEKEPRLQSRTKRLLQRTAHEKFHDKMDEYSRDNVGMESAYKIEQSGEFLYKARKTERKYYNHLKSNLQQKKTYKEEYKSAKGKFYEKALHNASSTEGMQTGTKKFNQKLYQRKVLYKAKAYSKYQNLGGTPSKAIINIAKNVMIRNKVLIGLMAALMVCIIVVPQAMSMGLGFLANMAVSTYPSDTDQLDKVVEYIEQIDTELAESVEGKRNGSYDSVTITYSGTGKIATDKMHMVSYLTVKFHDFKFREVKGEIDSLHSRLYTVNEHVETTSSTDAEGNTTTYYHLYVDVHCKTMMQLIEEENLLDEEERQWFDILNTTGGFYFGMGNLGNPFPGTDWTPNITSPYGFRIHPITGAISYHQGLDIAMPGGTPISSVQDGTVIEVGVNHHIFGNYVEIDDGHTRTKYAHCSQTLVKVGDKILTGDVIALVGTTGQSTGNHLHIEVYYGNKRVDPQQELSTQ